MLKDHFTQRRNKKVAMQIVLFLCAEILTSSDIKLYNENMQILCLTIFHTKLN